MMTSGHLSDPPTSPAVLIGVKIQVRAYFCQPRITEHLIFKKILLSYLLIDIEQH